MRVITTEAIGELTCGSSQQRPLGQVADQQVVEMAPGGALTHRPAKQSSPGCRPAGHQNVAQ